MEHPCCHEHSFVVGPSFAGELVKTSGPRKREAQMGIQLPGGQLRTVGCCEANAPRTAGVEITASTSTQQRAACPSPTRASIPLDSAR